MRATRQSVWYNTKCSLNEESLNSLDEDTDIEVHQSNGPATSHVSSYQISPPTNSDLLICFLNFYSEHQTPEENQNEPTVVTYQVGTKENYKTTTKEKLPYP